MELKSMSTSILESKKTMEAFKEVDDISSGKKKAKKYKNTSELRKDLNV